MTSTAATLDGAALISRVRAGQLPPVSVRKAIRRKAGVPLRDIAEVLGVSPMTVLRWEQGVAEPRLDNAIAYRQLLDGLSEATR